MSEITGTLTISVNEVTGSLTVDNTTVQGTVQISVTNLAGIAGDSAYEVWLSQGNSGTEQDFLDSLKGDQGDQGPVGTNGTNGQDGTDGQGVPPGGTTGQILAKVDDTDFNTEWTDAPSGGGSSDTNRVILSADFESTSNSYTYPAEFNFDLPAGRRIYFRVVALVIADTSIDFRMMPQRFAGGFVSGGVFQYAAGSSTSSGRPGGFVVTWQGNGTNPAIAIMEGYTGLNTGSTTSNWGVGFSQASLDASTPIYLKKGSILEWELLPE